MGSSSSNGRVAQIRSTIPMRTITHIHSIYINSQYTHNFIPTHIDAYTHIVCVTICIYVCVCIYVYIYITTI